MAALIWDSEAKAWKESTDIPMRWDPDTQAWTNTTGCRNNGTEWTEAWKPSYSFSNHFNNNTDGFSFLYGSTAGSYSVGSTAVNLSSGANCGIEMVSDYTITGKEKSMDITMTVSAEGGTYLESSYEFLGKVTGFKQSTYSYSRCFIGGKEITPKYSCPFTLRIVWKNPSTLHYINGALVQTKDFSPVVGMPIVSVKCSSWTTQSCSIDYISFDIEY